MHTSNRRWSKTRYVCICVYIHICIHVWELVWISVYVHTYVCMYLYAYVYTHISIRRHDKVCVYIQICINVYIQICIYVCTHAYIRKYVYTYVCMHIYTYMYIRVYPCTYLHICICILLIVAVLSQGPAASCRAPNSPTTPPLFRLPPALPPCVAIMNESGHTCEWAISHKRRSLHGWVHVCLYVYVWESACMGVCARTRLCMCLYVCICRLNPYTSIFRNHFFACVCARITNTCMCMCACVCFINVTYIYICMYIHI